MPMLPDRDHWGDVRSRRAKPRPRRTKPVAPRTNQRLLGSCGCCRMARSPADDDSGGRIRSLHGTPCAPWFADHLAFRITREPWSRKR
jgi:hypothetical protein